MRRPENPIPTLFFDEHGCGPDACDLALHPMSELKDGDEVIAARSVGLRVFASQGGIGGLIFATAGGYQLFEEQARALRDQLTAWIDGAAGSPTVTPALKPEECAALTPDQVDDLVARLQRAIKVRLDAADREVLLTAPDGGAVLVKSILGRWAAYYTDTRTGQPAEVFEWRASLDEARDDFTERTDIGWCANDWCKAQVDADTLQEDGEDGPKVCPHCFKVSLDAWNEADVHHAEPTDCPWTGKGADVSWSDDGDALCPKCGEEVSDIVIGRGAGVAPAVELDDDVTEDTRG